MAQWVKTLTAQDLYLNLTSRTLVKVKENQPCHLSSVHHMYTEAQVPPPPVITDSSLKKA